MSETLDTVLTTEIARHTRRRYFPRSLEELVHWYERYISPLSLVGGFIFDNLVLLRRVDLWQTDVLFFAYLGIASLGIVLLQLIEAGRVRWAWLRDMTPLVVVVVQFAFGGLFSGFVSLYSRSADFALTWIFVIMVAGLLLSNERFSRLYSSISMQIALLFTSLFAFLIFYLPIALHRIDPLMFGASALASLGLTVGFVFVLYALVPTTVYRGRWVIVRRIIGTLVVFNVLYYVNAIPPLPLAIKDTGVYHSVERVGDGTYRVTGESTPWYWMYVPHTDVVHVTPTESVYVWTAVFVPTDISTVLQHEWQYYDTTTSAWTTTGTIRFNVIGGRDGGYRGYSAKDAIAPGEWRVNVLNAYGRTIGRVHFIVEGATSTVPLVTSTL
jgi:hypothetical protein